MANIKSARKRIKIGERNKSRNKKYKSVIKTYTKKYLNLLTIYKKEPNTKNLSILNQTLNILKSKIDKGLKKKILHRNTAARRKSKFAYMLKNIS
uniref:ribosomal protein S20 n=1 Tax=Fibrocapsa japonica TaxID=94617 RepID=UPI0021156DF4|nr:ribosomal protein S20 [Fibrocapsa japonica]UTE95175.1 ribosomal protein S20 [Fibrocapsa japonica]